jgi:phosphohistidine phosphatase SixA
VEVFGVRVLSIVVFAALSWFAVGVNAQQSTDAEQLWSALKAGGHIALMRHALAPGTGDPGNFVIDDCSTQRNLSDRGREQARRIGREFRDRDIAIGRVLSSLWCRCLETAELLGLGSVEPFPVLNSFFRRTERRAEQTAGLREFVNRPIEGSSLVLVSHQVNITALTGVFPSSGEIIVIRAPEQGGTFEVLGRLLLE